jgi:glucose/arabinose dehydrogenase
MKQDAFDSANEPGVQPGGGSGVSSKQVPATVTGVTGDLGTEQSRGAGPKFELQTVASDLGQLTQVTSAPGDDGLWLVEKTGKLLRRDPDGSVDTKLDISSIVDGGGERGLLSVAFHPRFEQNGRLFLYYTEKGSGELHIAEATAGRGGEVERDTLTDVLVVDHPRGNHNGGQLQFGPDGMLYAGTGDGGGGGDPDDTGQDLGSHLGKILRLDVDNPADGKPYGIPADNPYVDTPGAQPEIYSTGVRNPWRFSFDREQGDLWIGDVGQNAWEEVNMVPRGQGNGANFGWDAREGAQAYRDTSEAADRPAMGPGTLVDPTLQYGRDEGFSITGGYVYRGDDIPSLTGYYVYSDIGSDTLRAVKVEDGAVVDRRELPGGRQYVVSYGEGPDGELYAVTLGGELTKVARPGSGTADGPSDGTGGSGGAVTEIGVQNGTMRFSQSEYRVKAGTNTFRLKNTDTSGMPHNVGVQGDGIRTRMSEMAFRGDTVELTMDLDPGTYELFCAPHMGGGMVARLVVEE